MLTLRLLGGLSLESDDGVVTGRAAQKRRLALLALLATAPSRTLTRDKLIGHLWPESESEQARHLLSVALYELRKALGEDVLVSRGDDVCLEGGFRTDLEALDEALAAGDAERAAALYSGPFLDGFYLSDAPEFERWVDVERDRWARRHQATLEALAAERTAAGDVHGAVEAWRRLAAIDPYNSRSAIGLVRALAGAGDRAGALQHARIHEVLLREEFGAEPDPELTALATRLREEPEAVAAPPVSREPLPVALEPLPVARDPLPASVGHDPATGNGQRAAGNEQRAAGSGQRVAAPWRRHRLVPAALAILVAAAVGIWAAWSHDWGRLRGDRGSIAVLPFTDLSPERDHEYFSDGLAEEIINALAQVEELRVAARTSSFAFRDRSLDVREVGEALGVGTVLEGSVRRSGDRLRVTARLVDVEDGYGLWEESYEREMDDVFRVQDEIARSVVAALRGELTERDTTRLARPTTSDPEAYNLYLQGRYHWYRRTGEGFRQAIGFFERAVSRDPTYALAYVGLGDVYSLLGAYDYGVLPPSEAFPRAKDALGRALQLDPESAEARAALGNVLMNYDWDWRGAEREFRRAIELNPGYAPAHHWYALDLLVMGRREEALREVRRARELEPLSLVMSTGMARVLYFTRDHAAAEAEYRRALAMDSSFVTARLGLGLTLLQRGSPDAALAEYRTALRLLGGSQPVVSALVAHALAVSGRTAEAREALAALERETAARYVPPEYLALVRIGLGERDEAMALLEQAYANRSGAMAFLGVEPLLDPLRSDPGFVALMERVGV